MFTKRTALLVGFAVTGIATPAAQAQSEPLSKETPYTPMGIVAAPAQSQMLPGGFRRSEQIVRQPAPASNGDKAGELDPQTGEVLMRASTFYLPDNWNWSTGDTSVDSMGRSIVNRPLGLPAWSQADVDGLRQAISDTLTRTSVIGGDSMEGAAVLGNFIGQAVVRGIDVADLVSLRDTARITPTVADAIIERMHAYEAARFDGAARLLLAYEPTHYSPEVIEFVESHGHLLEDVLAVDPTGNDGIADRSVPSGCYVRINGGGYGLNLLSNANVIWEADNTDDAWANVPIGFPFNFYECEDATPFTGVRVSTNGFLTFYQHGGSTLAATEFNNLAIGSSVAPDGFVAGYWDDFQMLNQSSFPDRVSWKIEGVLSARTLTVEWFSVSRRGGTTTDYHTFQIILHEYRTESGPARNPITLAYGEPNSYWLADTIDSGTVGIEGFQGITGECIDSCNILTNIPPRNYIFYPLMNDECFDALPLQIGGRIVGDLSNSHSDSAQCGNGNGDRWYYFDPPCSGMLTIDTCGTNDAPGVDLGVDTLLSVFHGCPGSGGTLLACDDDGGTGCNDFGDVLDSRVSLSVQPGQRYHVRVTSFSPVGAVGAYVLFSSFSPDALAPNNNCDDAFAINPGVTVGGNLLCATSDGIASCGNFSNDLWYRYNATLGGTLRVSTCFTNDFPGIDRGMDTVVSLYNDCPGIVSNEVACNDDAFGGSNCGDADAGSQLDSVVFGSVSGNQSLLIRVGAFSTSYENGAFLLHTEFLPADLTGDCSVDLTDLATLLSYFGVSSGAGLAQGDIDGDADVDLTDLANLLSQFGTICP